MDKKYFIADLHFGHKNILTLANRRFSSIEEHDQYVIDCINSIVDKGDLLYILGDLGYRSDKEKLKEMLLRINTRNIHVVKGNHDKLATLVEFKRTGVIADVKEYMKVQKGNDTVVCFHYPIREWEGYYHGWYHAYGHCIDIDTEILTKDGWKNYYDISKDDRDSLLGKLNSNLANEKLIQEYMKRIKYLARTHHFEVEVKNEQNNYLKIRLDSNNTKLQDKSFCFQKTVAMENLLMDTENQFSKLDKSFADIEQAIKFYNQV